MSILDASNSSGIQRAIDSLTLSDDTAQFEVQVGYE